MLQMLIEPIKFTSTKYWQNYCEVDKLVESVLDLTMLKMYINQGASMLKCNFNLNLFFISKGQFQYVSMISRV